MISLQLTPGVSDRPQGLLTEIIGHWTEMEMSELDAVAMGAAIGYDPGWVTTAC